MSSLVGYAGALVMGIVVGVLHFGGLYLTIRRASHARNPWLMVVVSYPIRMAVVAAFTIVVVRAGTVIHAGLVVAGLLVARMALVRWLRPLAAHVGDR